MIKEVRAFLKSVIRSVDSDLKENKSVFYDGDIGESILDRSFQIELNTLNNIERNSHFTDTLEAQIIIFGLGRRKEEQLESYDELLEKAQCIRDSIFRLDSFSNRGNIIDIVAGSIVSEQLPDNDNGFRININLTLSLAYSREN